MTVDDESSVYVGGIPYDSTEDSLRKIFNLYGSVVAVKIINDRSTRGKCYAFITFTNPRSAIDAINDMDGRTIEGRVVRVNEVKSRGGRLAFSRDSFRRDHDRGMDQSRGDRGRDRDYDKDRHWDRYEERSRERDHSRDNDADNERDHQRTNDQDRAGDHLVDRERDLGRDAAENEHQRSMELKEDHDMDLDGRREMDRRENRDNDEHKGKRKGSDLDDYYNRELSSDSAPYDQLAKEQLDLAIQQREDLQAEIAQIEAKLDENHEHVSNLQKKSKKLEDSLTAAKRLTTQRKMQLSKLHKCYLRMRDYSEKLKHCEQDLQSLIDSALIDSDIRDDAGLRRGVLINGDV